MDTVAGSGPMSWLDSLLPSSQTAREVSEFPWETTSLGSPESWSDGLKSAVQVCLSSSAPILLAWGPDLIRIFNDAYVELAGEANLVGSLGMDASTMWSDVWADLGPELMELQQGHTSHAIFQRRFVIDGAKHHHERWLEYSGSCIRGGDTDNGVFFMVADTTGRVVAKRHLICLRDLATGLLEAKDLTDVCIRAARLLSENTKSLPWAEFRVVEDRKLIRVATTLTRAQVPPNHHQVTMTLTTGRPRVIHDGPDVIDIRSNQPPEEGAWTYFAPLGFDQIRGVFVAGLNPEHQSDPVYRAFVDLCWKAISVAIDSVAHHTEELQTQRRISSTLQEAMLSPATDSPTVAARYVPATGGLVVGGDWYDVIGLSDGRKALTVGDCVGHDLEAAAIMGQLRSASRALLIEGNSPAQVLNAMDLFAGVIDGLAATMVCAILDPSNGQITYSVAGHPPGLLLGKERSEWLDQATGTPLGVRTDARTETTAMLTDKDLVLFYSDGLIERRNEPLTCGLERLRVLCEAHWADPVQTFADTILSEMYSTGAPDDIVLVAARNHTD